MDMDGSSRRGPPDRRSRKKSVQKLKFKPKVPAQKAKKPPMPATERPQQEEQLKPVDKELLRILRTREATKKPAPSTNDDHSTQNPPSMLSSAAKLSSQPSGHRKGQPKTLHIPRSVPAPVNPGKFYNDDDNGDGDDHDNTNEFEEPQPSSTECETSIPPAAELNLLEENDKERMFLFQLPKYLPLLRKSDIVERKGKATGKEEAKKGCNLQQLPPGYLGKMLVYKSGKIKMKLGDIMFDVNPGVEHNMQQHAAAINSREKHCCVLGEIEKRHIIVTPDVDSLLNAHLE